MGRAEVTDRGLAGRLGEEVALTKEDIKSGKRKFGILIYYPDRYGLLFKDKKGKEKVIPIVDGDLVGLRINDFLRGRNYMPDYIYRED